MLTQPFSHAGRSVNELSRACTKQHIALACLKPQQHVHARSCAWPQNCRSESSPTCRLESRGWTLSGGVPTSQEDVSVTSTLNTESNLASREDHRFRQAASVSLKALKSPPLLADMQALALQGISEEIQLDIHLQQCISARTGVRQPQGAGDAPRLAKLKS